MFTTSSVSLPVHFRVLLLLCWWCWFLFPFIRPSFLIFNFIISLQVACPFCGLPGLGFGVVLVTVSRLTLCLFVCPMLCCVLFRWVRGVRVSSGLSPFLGWIVCVSCPVAALLSLCSLSHVLRFSRSGSFALLFIVRVVAWCVICWGD